MASRPPPRFVVRRHDDVGNRRRWIWLGLIWLCSLVLTAVLTTLLTRSPSITASSARTQRDHQAQIDALKQEIANLQRAAQVDQVANRALQGNLAQREEEINGLRADLGFYSRLVGGDAQRQGLKLQEVKLVPIQGAHGWNLTLGLTQNARRGKETEGHATVSVEGIRADKVERLEWPALGDAEQKNGLPFRFLYFQQLQSTIVLPADFRPTQLHIKVQAGGDAAVVRSMPWSEALNGSPITTQEKSDAQP